MSQNIGTLVTAPIRVNDSTDSYPSALSSEIQGAPRVVADLTALYALSAKPLQLQQDVTIVTVLNDGIGNRQYKLTDATNIGNSSGWTLYTNYLGISGASILNQTTLQASSNFYISGTGKSATNFIVQKTAINSPSFLINDGSGLELLRITSDNNTNLFIGYQTGFSNTSGVNNTGLGSQALYTNTSGGYNSAFGYQALNLNQTGTANTGLGVFALMSNTSGNDNVAIGFRALQSNTTANNNVAIGYNSLFANITGHENIAIGALSTLSLNTTGIKNVALGYASLAANIIGSSNLAIGVSSLIVSTGDGNTAVGGGSGGAITTGIYNTLLGYNGSNITTGGYNLSLGAFVDAVSNTSSGQLNIGNVLYGINLYQTTSNSSTPTTTGSIGIGLTTPTARLHLVAGTATAGTSPLKLTSGTNLSTPESGAIEFDGTHYYGTIGSTRFQLDQQTGGGTYSFTSPLTLTGSVVSIPAATTSVSGYLTSTDWTTFNSKQTALVSGTSIKTINSTSLLGSGNLPLIINGTSLQSSSNFNISGTGTATSSNGSISIGGSNSDLNMSNISGDTFNIHVDNSTDNTIFTSTGGSIIISSGSNIQLANQTSVGSTLSANEIVSQSEDIVTAGGATTLSYPGDVQNIRFTGSSNQIVLLPAVNTLFTIGQHFILNNTSSGSITVQSSGGNTIQVMATGTVMSLMANSSSGTGAGVWSIQYYTGLSGSAVSSISIASSNGFTGSSSGGTTPALTLGTSITGLLKGNGTAILAATSGTDYVIPSGNITGTAGNLSGTPALPNGTTATTQSSGDNSTKLSTTAYVDNIKAGLVPYSGATGVVDIGANGMKAQDFVVTGTGSAGYVAFQTQTTAVPSAPSGFDKLYFDASDVLHSLNSAGINIIYSPLPIPTTVKTSSYTAVVNDIVLTDTTSGTIAITLPTTPINGSLIWVKQTLGSNLTTITAGGSDVFNTSGGLISISLIGANQGVQLQYNSGIWYSTASNLPIALLDLRYSALAGSTSLTTLGTIGTGTWQGTLISPTYGGTGVNNGSFTSTLAGNFTTSGAFPLTLTQTASTNVTLPTTGTLATLTGTETFTNKTLTSSQLNTPLLNTTSTVGYVWTATNTAGAGSWQVASSGFSNPMTTVGDLILGGTSGAATRLAIGSNTFVLTSNGTTASWQAATGGGGTITLTGAVTGSGTSGITTTLASSIVGISNLSATGTPSSTTYLRGDNTWATPSGSGTVTSIVASTGLTGGTITTTGTLAIDQTFTPTWTGLHTFQKNSLGVTAADAIVINTTTAAANNAQQESPSLHLQGLGWGTTAATSQSVDARVYLLPVQGTVPTSQLNIDFANSGGTYTNRTSFFSTGGMTTTGNIAGNAGNFTNTVNALKAGIGTTSTDGFLANNTNAATSGTPVQIAPRLRYSGTVWNTSGTPAKNQFDWITEARAVSSGTPTTTLYFSSSIVTGTTPSFTDIVSLNNLGNLNLLTGSLTLSTAGSKINITTGSNASAGTATLSSGTVTISTTAVTTSSLIFVVYNTPSGTLASGLSAPVGSITGGTSFVINSLTTAGVVNTLDNSTVRWWFIN